MVVSLGLASALYINSAYAGCERSDVSYYLKEGFTPEQITTICSEAPKPASKTEQAPAVTPAAPAPVTSKPVESVAPIVAPIAIQKEAAAPSSETEKKLQSLINGKQIILTDDALGYVQKICVSYEYDTYYPPTQVVCPKAEVTIQREGLVVVKAEKILFEGSQVRVKGAISKKILETFEDKDADEKKIILDALKDNSSTNIQVKNKASADELAQILREISK